MRRLLHRVLAATLGLVLMFGPVAVCAAMAPTSEARMACCTDDDKCPMHEGGARGSDSHHVPSQSEADQCCVASGGGTPNQSMPMSATVPATPVLGASVLLPQSVPALVRTDAWRAAVPLRVTPVPRHLLLAVFLI